MYINFKTELFMPEGDDFSKEAFDKETEEILHQGNQVLIKLREEQMKQLAATAKPKVAVYVKEDKQQEDEKNLTYKEILKKVAARNATRR